MVAPDQPPCHRDLLPERCAYEHVAAALERGASGSKSMRLCPCHDDRKASLSVNFGTQGMRIVWNCGTGCAPADIRAELLVRGVDESCLGRYGLPKPGGASGLRTHSPDPVLVAKGNRYDAIVKLPRDLNGKLYLMCVQAIIEGDGGLPPDPISLLPVIPDDFYALADRTGIDAKYKYRLYKQWVRSDGF